MSLRIPPSKMTGITRCRNFLVTLNNPTDAQEVIIGDLVINVNGLKYAGGQYEVGDNGTPHWQGYLQFKAQKTTTAAAALLESAGVQMHLTPCTGKPEKGKHYVSKPHDGCTCEHCVHARTLPNNGLRDEDGFAELGVFSAGSGERTDIVAIMARIREGASDRDIADEFPGNWVRYHRAFERYRCILAPVERTWVTHTTVLWGPPGTGKTRRAFELAGPGAYWVTYGTSATAPQYYDGYDGQECVVFDEFFGQIRRQEMCKLLDEYPCNVPTRGGQQPWLPKRVIITSNTEPVQWWSRLGLGPMARRLSGNRGEIHHMQDVYVDPTLDEILDTQCVRCGKPSAECICAAIEVNMQRRGEWMPFGS